MSFGDILLGSAWPSIRLSVLSVRLAASAALTSDPIMIGIRQAHLSRVIEWAFIAQLS
jgi:hypothetical protein